MEELLEEYSYNLSAYTLFLSKLTCAFEAIECGEVINEEELEEIVSYTELFQSLILQNKEELGYTDELSFLENNNFDGFRIENGVLIGDSDDLNIWDIVSPWFNGFPETVNHYQFEVANYVLSLLLRKERNLI